MAARIKRFHDDETRQRIKTSQLINRLQDDALGEIELKDGQRKSIEILLRKSLPDLAAIQISGDADSPIKMVIEWQAKQGS